MDPLSASAFAKLRERVLIARDDGYARDMGGGDQLAALRDVIAVLERAGAAHALIGGLAVGIRTGVPRATLDIDLAVRSGMDRAMLISALSAAGFQLVGQFAHSVNFRHGNGEPVQLAFDPSFDPMIERAEPYEIGAWTVRVVRKDDLILLKRQAASDPARRRSKALRDQADLAMLMGDVPNPDEGW